MYGGSNTTTRPPDRLKKGSKRAPCLTGVVVTTDELHHRGPSCPLGSHARSEVLPTEARPRRRTMLEQEVPAPFTQRGESGKFAGVDERSGITDVEAIETDHEELVLRHRLLPPPAAERGTHREHAVALLGSGYGRNPCRTRLSNPL